MSTRGFAQGLARALLTCTLLCLAACGGGGGSDSGANNSSGNGSASVSSEPPTINASILLMAPLENAVSTSSAHVAVFNQAGTAPITNAVVKVNGEALAYNSLEKAYTGDRLNLAPGWSVTVTIAIGSFNYVASSTLVNNYPTITAPTGIVTWDNDAANHVQWTDASTGPQTSYLLGMLGKNTPDWPANGLLPLPGLQTGYDLGPGVLAPDGYQLLVGSAYESNIPGASPGSTLKLVEFAHIDVQVSSAAGFPPSATIKDVVIDTNDPTAIVKGTTRQLNARAQYTDFSNRYITGKGTWSSSNPSVLTVSSQGKLTALATGTAQLSIAYGGYMDTVAISVFQPTAIPMGPATSSTTMQIGPGHAGYATLGGSSIVLPLVGRWTATLNGPPSYPVVANGKVFVTTAAPAVPHPNGYGSSLYALDVTSGAIVWGPVDLAGIYNSAMLAYDQGRLFVQNSEGLRAIDAATGTEIWFRTYPSNYLFSPLVAAGGMVFTSSSSAVVVVDESYGGLFWSATYLSSGGSSPAISADGVFVSGPCHVDRLGLFSGESVWKYEGPCHGSGGKIPVYSDGKLVVRDNGNNFPSISSPNAIFDAGTGSIATSFPSSDLAALAGGVAYYLTNGRLSALNLATSVTQWTFAGDLGLNTPPIVIDGVVVVGSSSGNIYMVDRASGQQLWSGQAAKPLGGLNENQSLPMPTMGIGNGYLIVPAANTLTGWKLVP